MKKKIKIENLVSPENRMDAARLAKFDPNSKNAVVVMDENNCLLFMYTVQLRFFEDTLTNYLASIIYDKKKKTLQMRGRMLFFTTGNKTAFHDKPVPYSLKNLNDLKEKIRKVPMDLAANLPHLSVDNQPTILSFEIDEPIESVIKKMNDTNEFDIGQMGNPKKKDE